MYYQSSPNHRPHSSSQIFKKVGNLLGKKKTEEEEREEELRKKHEEYAEEMRGKAQQRNTQSDIAMGTGTYYGATFNPLLWKQFLTRQHMFATLCWRCSHVLGLVRTPTASEIDSDESEPDDPEERAKREKRRKIKEELAESDSYFSGSDYGGGADGDKPEFSDDSEEGEDVVGGNNWMFVF